MTRSDLPLSSHYSDRTLLISGLSSDGSHERYLLVNLATGRLCETSIDTTPLRERLLAVLRERLADQPVPYGLARLEDLLSYFLHPHSALQSAGGDIVISFKQAPYLRLLRPGQTESPLVPKSDDIDFTLMLSSTACELRPGVIGYGVTDGGDRLCRYVDGYHPLRSSIWQLDLRSGQSSRLGDLPEFLLDTMHQLSVSSLGFLACVDMNLSVEPDPDGVLAGVSPQGMDVAAYATNHFPQGRFAVVDSAFTRTTIQTTSAPCSAHVDFDLEDPEVFYVSCNAISKWQNQVVVHGPGALERYRYRDGQVVREGVFTRPQFLRITSQLPFHQDGRQLIAVTGYPNQLFVIDPATMTEVQRVELYPEEVPVPPFTCAKNSIAPLYLATDETGRYIFMTGASTLFVVDLCVGRVVDRVEFCQPGSLMATAHVTMVDLARDSMDTR